MLYKRRVIATSFIVLSLFLTTCKNKVNNEIDIPELLLLYTEEISIDYSNLLNSAISGDLDALREFSLLDFRDAVAYDHGCVMVDMISIVGEETFIKGIETISDQQKVVVKGYISAGLEYGNQVDFGPADFRVVFPKIYAFINNI